MNKNWKNRTFRSQKQQALKKKVHRAMLEARNALHRGDKEEARAIVSRVMTEAAPEAYRVSREGGHNWVVEALKPLEELLLPDDDQQV